MNLPLPPILVPALLAAVCWMLALITMVRVWPWSWPAHRDRVVSSLLWLALGCALLLSAVGLALVALLATGIVLVCAALKIRQWPVPRADAQRVAPPRQHNSETQ